MGGNEHCYCKATNCNSKFKQKNQLYELLHEYWKKLTQEKTVSLLGVHTEFYSFHISQVLNNCQHLFTIDDIYRCIEIWRKVYALNILCILDKVFCYIVANTDSLELFYLDQSMDSLPDEWLSIRDDSQAKEFALWDSYMLQSFGECSQIAVEDDNESVEQPLDQTSFTEWQFFEKRNQWLDMIPCKVFID